MSHFHPGDQVMYVPDPPIARTDKRFRCRVVGQVHPRPRQCWWDGRWRGGPHNVLLRVEGSRYVFVTAQKCVKLLAPAAQQELFV